MYAIYRGETEMKPFEDSYPDVFATFEEYEISDEVKAEIAMQRVEDVD